MPAGHGIACYQPMSWLGRHGSSWRGAIEEGIRVSALLPFSFNICGLQLSAAVLVSCSGAASLWGIWMMFSSRLDLHCHWKGPSIVCISKSCCRSLLVVDRYRLRSVASAQQLEVQEVAAAPVTSVDRAILVQGRVSSTVSAATRFQGSVSPGEGRHVKVIAP